jgi:hypothetical protein
MLYKKALAAKHHALKQHIQHSMLLGMLPQQISGGSDIQGCYEGVTAKKHAYKHAIHESIDKRKACTMLMPT